MSAYQTTLNVEGITGLQQLRKRIRITRAALPSYQLVLARNIAINDVLKAIHDAMRGYGVSEKIINGTKITRVEFAGRNKIRVYVISRYFAGSFDVAKARHDGTEDHRIEPLSVGSPFIDKPEALHWNGFFSKGHDVSGLPRLEYIEKTVNRLKQHITDEFNKQQRIWIQKMLAVQ